MAKFPEAQEFDLVQKGTELIELFEKYIDANTVLGLPESEKKEFLRKYYSKLRGSEEVIGKLRDEGENYYSTMQVPHVLPPEQLVLIKIIGLIYVAKANLMPQLMDIYQKHNHIRREQLKGLAYTDNNVAKILQQCILNLNQEIRPLLLKEIIYTANKRGFPAAQINSYANALLSKDIKTCDELYQVYCSQRAEHLAQGDPISQQSLSIYLEESIALNSKVWQPQTDPKAIFFYPQLISDELYTKTGLDKPVLMHLILEELDKDTLLASTLDLAIREAFVLEGIENK